MSQKYPIMPALAFIYISVNTDNQLQQSISFSRRLNRDSLSGGKSNPPCPCHCCSCIQGRWVTGLVPRSLWVKRRYSMDMLPFYQRAETQTTTHAHTYGQFRLGNVRTCFWTIEIPHGENVETAHRKAKCRDSTHCRDLTAGTWVFIEFIIPDLFTQTYNIHLVGNYEAFPYFELLNTAALLNISVSRWEKNKEKWGSCLWVRAVGVAWHVENRSAWRRTSPVHGQAQTGLAPPSLCQVSEYWQYSYG